MRKFDVGTYVVCKFEDREMLAKVIYFNKDGKTVHVELEDNEFNVKYTKVNLKKVRHIDEMDELTTDEYLDLMILARSLNATDLYYSYRNKLSKNDDYTIVKNIHI